MTRKDNKEIRDGIAKICHDDDFTTEMADRSYITEEYETAPEEVKASYREQADRILAYLHSKGYQKKEVK